MMKDSEIQRNAALGLAKSAVLVIALLMPLSAQAELRLCNQSFDVLNIALAQAQGDGFRSRGWWRVAPNQCATLLREPLRERYFYVFAADVFGKVVLAGSVPMCVAPRRFETGEQTDCLLRGFLDARFLEIDTGDQPNWTVFVAPRPG